MRAVPVGPMQPGGWRPSISPSTAANTMAWERQRIDALQAQNAVMAQQNQRRGFWDRRHDHRDEQAAITAAAQAAAQAVAAQQAQQALVPLAPSVATAPMPPSIVVPPSMPDSQPNISPSAPAADMTPTQDANAPAPPMEEHPGHKVGRMVIIALVLGGVAFGGYKFMKSKKGGGSAHPKASTTHGFGRARRRRRRR